MSKFVGFIVGAALVVVGIATGNPALIIQGGLMIVSNAILLLTQPKQPARAASEMSIQLGEQPRVLLVGETATAGSLVDGFNYGGKYGTDWECLVIRLADHKCHSLTGFYVNDEYVPYTHNGNYPQFDDDHFELYFRADTTAEGLPSVVLDHAPGWTSADVGESGCDVVVCYRADKPDAKHPAWPGGRPRFLFVVKGAFCYDPRLDDTVDGGAGDHRIDDPDTWEWSENAAICRYKWVRGVYANDANDDQTALLVGRGLTAEEAPPENVFAPANLCDEVTCPFYPAATIDTNFDFSVAGFSYNFGQVYLTDNTGFMVVDVRSQTVVYEATGINIDKHIAINPDGSFYAGAVGSDGVSLVSVTGGHVEISTSTMSGGVWKVTAGIFGRHGSGQQTILQLGGASVTSTSVSFYPSWYFDDADGGSWAVGGISGGIGGPASNGVYFRDFATMTEHLVATGHQGSAYAFDNGAGGFCLWQDDKLFVVDKMTFLITAGPTAAFYPAGGGGDSSEKLMLASVTGDDFIWINFNKFDSRDATLLETATQTNWDITEDGDGAGVVYDRVNNALLRRNIIPSELQVYYLTGSGYRVAGPIYSNQDFIEVEGMFAAATGGTVVTREGSVELNPGHAESIVAAFTDDDLLSGSQVSWNQGILSESSDEWVNTIVPNYVEPTQKWAAHNAPVLRDTADILTDGKPREAQITLRLVRYSDQAQRVGEIQRRLGRIWGRASVKLGPRFCEIEDGDWIQWQSDRYFGGATKTFRVEAYSIDEKWQIQLTLREISATVYGCPEYIVDQSRPSRPPPPPEIGAPDEANWTLTAITLDSEGASLPALHIEGDSSDDPYVESITIEYWVDDGVTDPTADPDAISWTTDGSYAPSSTFTRDITSVTGGETYYAAVTYVVGGEPGDRLVLGPVTLTDYAPSAFYQLEDSFTPIHLEDSSTLVHLG